MIFFIVFNLARVVGKKIHVDPGKSNVNINIFVLGNDDPPKWILSLLDLEPVEPIIEPVDNSIFRSTSSENEGKMLVKVPSDIPDDKFSDFIKNYPCIDNLRDLYGDFAAISMRTRNDCRRYNVYGTLVNYYIHVESCFPDPDSYIDSSPIQRYSCRKNTSRKKGCVSMFESNYQAFAIYDHKIKCPGYSQKCVYNYTV